MDGVTPPEIGRQLGVSRAVVDRVLEQYKDRLHAPMRVGNSRCYPTEIITAIRDILDTERRANEVRR